MFLFCFSFAFGDVVLTNTTTQYNLSNGLILYEVNSGSANTNLYYYNGSVWVHYATIDYDDDAITINEVLLNTSSIVRLNVTTTEGDFNITLADGANYFSVENATELTGDFYIDKVSDFSGSYYYSPNTSLNIMNYTAQQSLASTTNWYNIIYKPNESVAYLESFNRKTSSGSSSLIVANGFSRSIWDDTGDAIAGYYAIGILPNINVSAGTGNTAIDYGWANWTFSPTTPQNQVTDSVTDYTRYWAFNEGTGTNVDDAGSDDADLTLNSSDGWVGGIYSYGYNFTHGYATSNDFTNLDDDTEGTISLWMKIDADNGAGNLEVSFSNNATATPTSLYLRALMDSSDSFTGAVIIDGVTQWAFRTATNSLDPYVGKCLHITVVHNGTEPIVYFNGVEESITFTTDVDRTVWLADLFTATNPSDTFTVGGIWNNGVYSGPFIGCMDEVRIYSDALTASEIASIYGYRTDMRRYFNFNEGTGSSADDAGPFDKDLTITGGDNWAEGKQSWNIHYDGTDNYASSTDLTGLICNYVGTISLWAKWDDDPAADEDTVTIFNDADTTLTGQQLYFQASDDDIRASVTIDDVVSWAVETPDNSADVCVGNWCHIVLIQNGTGPEIWLNGVKQSLTYDTTTDLTDWFSDIISASTPADTLTVGGLSSNGGVINDFDGLIDEVRVYNRNLSASEIASLYGQGLPDVFSGRSGTYAGYTTNNSIAEYFTNSTLRPYLYSDNTTDIGNGDSFITRNFNFTLIDNDFGIEPYYTMCCDNCYNPSPSNYLFNFNLSTGSRYLWFDSTYDGNNAKSQEEVTDYAYAFFFEGNGYNENITAKNMTMTGVTYEPLIGQGALFTGASGSYAINTSAGNLDFTNPTSYSFNVWIKPTSEWAEATERVIFDMEADNGNTLYRLYKDTDDLLHIWSRKATGGNADVSYDLDWSINTPYMITVTQAFNGDLTLYVNTVDVGSEASTSSPIAGADLMQMSIGRDYDSDTGHFAGIIDDWRMYRKILSQDEIDLLYLSGATKVLNFTDTNDTIISSCDLLPLNSTLYQIALTLNLLDEQNDSAIISNVDSNLTVVSSGKGYNFSFSGNSTYNICIYPSDREELIYDSMNYYSGAHSSRYHYLINTSVSSTPQNVLLFLLQSSEATITNFIVVDSTGSRVPNVIVLARREDLGAGSFKSIAMASTDDQGETAIPLEFNDVRYDFQVINVTTGEIIKTSSPIILTTENVPVTLNIGVSIFDYWERVGYVIYNSSFTNVSTVYNFTINALDTSGLTTGIQLECYRLGVLGNNKTYSQTVSSTSASLTCELGNVTNNRYMMTTTILFSDGANVQFQESFDGTVPFNYSTDGVIAGVFMLIALATGFAVSPVASLMALIGGLVIILQMGFTLLDTDTIMILIMSLFIVLWLVRRGKR